MAKSSRKTAGKRSSRQLTPAGMRLALSVLLVAILGGMSGGFYVIYTMLQTTAAEVSAVQTEAKASDAKLQELQRLERELARHSDIVKKAEQIVAESKNYQYQNQIIEDLEQHATKAGLRIVGFTFGSGAAAGSSGAPAAAVSGLKTTQVTIQFGGEVPYVGLLRFIHLIEQNLTRMQIASVSMTRSEKPGGVVGAQGLQLEVYIR